MLQHAREFRVHTGNAANRNAKLAVIERSRPGWRLGDVYEFSLCVENYDNVFGGLIAELPGEVLILILHCREQLLLQLRGRSVALVVQSEMPALLAPPFQELHFVRSRSDRVFEITACPF